MVILYELVWTETQEEHTLKVITKSHALQELGVNYMLGDVFVP